MMPRIRNIFLRIVFTQVHYVKKFHENSCKKKKNNCKKKLSGTNPHVRRPLRDEVTESGIEGPVARGSGRRWAGKEEAGGAAEKAGGAAEKAGGAAEEAERVERGEAEKGESQLE